MGLAAAAIAKNFGAASVAATSRKVGKEELMKASGVDKVISVEVVVEIEGLRPRRVGSLSCAKALCSSDRPRL